MLFVLFTILCFMDYLSSGSVSEVSTKRNERSNEAVDEDDDFTSFCFPQEERSWSYDNLTSLYLDRNMTAGFVSRSTFACPLVKSFLETGHSVADLTPEDVEIVAAMGDSLAAGKGLWLNSDIEMRGAAFPIGGDADIDDIATIPNVLQEFNNKLEGQSHGMGTLEQLPDSQLNCAKTGARTADMLEQATELVRRLHRLYGPERIRSRWLLIIITVGTDQLCRNCSSPAYSALHRTLKYLHKYCPRSLVVLIGPIGFRSSQQSAIQLFRERCECMRSQSLDFLKKLFRSWTDAFCKLQNLFNSDDKTTFALITVPFLTVSDEDPDSFLSKGQLLLNRKGHSYAARWLWNTLVGVAHDNGTFEDAFYCPSADCPYFRTSANREVCKVQGAAEAVTYSEGFFNDSTTSMLNRREHMKRHLPLVILVIFVSALISVIFFGTIFYRIGLKATKSRFEVVRGV